MLPCAEPIGQKLPEGHGLIALFVHHVNKEIVLTELPHDLAADPAGRKGPGDNATLAAADSDGGKVPVTVIDGLKNSGSLSAVGGALGGVFDVAALIDGSVGTQQRRPHLIAGIGYVGMGHRLNS